MALAATQEWWIRTDGNVANGGGYDPTVSGAGTNYSNEASPQLSLTDLTSTNSTTITSVAGGFTAAMIGNILRLASGSGTTPGYYMVLTRTDTNTITVDRVSGTYTVGVGRIGGAFVSLASLMSTGNLGLTAPAIATPLLAGNTIHLQGAGSNDPSGVDYDYSGTLTSSTGGYWTAPSGSLTSGRIALIGYNGRPHIKHGGLFLYQVQFWYAENLKFSHPNSTQGYTTYGLWGGLENDGVSNFNMAKNLICDLYGRDAIGLIALSVMDCEIRNSGGGAAGTGCGLSLSQYGGLFVANYIDSVRGDGIRDNTYNGAAGMVYANLIRKVGRDGLRFQGTAYQTSAVANTVSECTGDGVEITVDDSIAAAVILSNILSTNTGNGINNSVGTAALNDRLVRGMWDYNDLNGNGTARTGISAGANDSTLDPQFTNAAGEDYRIGTNLKARGFPQAFRGSSSTGYVDTGAVQRQEPMPIIIPRTIIR